MTEEKNPGENIVTTLLNPVANTYASFVKLQRTGKVFIEVEFDNGQPVGDGVKIHTNELCRFKTSQNQPTNSQEGK